MKSIYIIFIKKCLNLRNKYLFAIKYNCQRYFFDKIKKKNFLPNII